MAMGVMETTDRDTLVCSPCSKHQGSWPQGREVQRQSRGRWTPSPPEKRGIAVKAKPNCRD